MTRNKILLAISLVARIGTGLVSLLVLARGLGPTDYGFVATVFAYSSIAALLTDFGFSVQALRDIGAEPDRAGDILAACIRVKNILVGGVSAIAVVVLAMLGLDGHLLLASILLFASIMVAAYGDLMLVALRGIGRYATETWVVVAGAVLFVVVVGGTALYWPEILPIAVAMLAARLGQAAFSFAAAARHIRLGNCVFGPLLDIMGFMRSSSGLALDSVLTTISGQLDVIFVSAMLGLEAAGVYQVAARVTGYALQPIQVLAGVFMPMLSFQHHSKDQALAGAERRMRRELVSIGLIAGIGMAFVMPLASPLIFGSAFELPYAVWVAFGVLTLLRYIVSSFGISLTAKRGVMYRLLGQGLAVTILLVLIPTALNTSGMVGAPIAMSIATLVTTAIYIWANKTISSARSPEHLSNGS